MKPSPVPSTRILRIFAPLLLAACGGGGGDSGSSTMPAPAPVQPSTAEGLWNGSTSSSRAITIVVLDNNTVWALYSAQNKPSVVAGAIQGTGTALNGSVSSSDSKDFSLEGLGTNSVNLSGSYVTKQSLNGTVTYPALNNLAVTFTSTYNAAYEQTPSLTTIAGTYTGVAGVGGTEAATFVITPTGAISRSGGGCPFTGTVAPHAKGNVYDLSVTFAVNGTCAIGSLTFNGVGYFDAATKRFSAVTIRSDRSMAFIFDGTMP